MLLSETLHDTGRFSTKQKIILKKDLAVVYLTYDGSVFKIFSGLTQVDKSFFSTSKDVHHKKFIW